MTGVTVPALALGLATLLQVAGTSAGGPDSAAASSPPLPRKVSTSVSAGGPDAIAAPVTPLRAAVSASVGVAPDTVTVGDSFRVLVRVAAPDGAVVEFPRFRLVEPVEATDSLRIRRDAEGRWTATYTLAAWSVSDSLVGTFPFRVSPALNEARDYRVQVRLPVVRSVLPVDSTLHLPRPARGVIPLAASGPRLQGWVTPVLLALLAAAVVAWLLLRRRGPTAMMPEDPRSAALAALDAMERERLPGRGLLREYHRRSSRILREYVRAQEGGGEDLTTTELVRAFRSAGAERAIVVELERLLGEADRLKFSGPWEAADPARVDRHHEALRRWIIAWPPPPSVQQPRSAEAA